MATVADIAVEFSMVRPHDDAPLVYLCVEPVDGRKQINGLAALVQDTLQMNPSSEQLFVFTNRRRDRCRISYWERSGFVMWIKRLEKAHFSWPGVGADDA